MEISLYQIDAFASELFKGNPAAVCPLEEWLPDETMQSIAEENNLSETAFFLPTLNGFHIRWFSPKGEVDLCGHATLATAYVLFNILGYKREKIEFDSRSGLLLVTKSNDRIILDFPSQPPVLCDIPNEIIRAFDIAPIECLKSEDYIAVFEREIDIESAKPNLNQLAKLDLRGVIITAKSSKYDFIARFFAPKYGIPEDPVTGSAYTQIAPYWASKKGINRFSVKQVSLRGGELTCEIVDNRVLISGKAIKYFEGKINIVT
ncbi:MAG: PhzF family phenazine biosynthesis protein [Desulfatitalea sp.]|nr:PhzF family phenazine biosynthesis protein [Desulfatitalea sp.]NNK02243.1 PhzF family phenazine biosynthesis protein [Desulfatitalea sp.]